MGFRGKVFSQRIGRKKSKDGGRLELPAGYSHHPFALRKVRFVELPEAKLLSAGQQRLLHLRATGPSRLAVCGGNFEPVGSAAQNIDGFTSVDDMKDRIGRAGSGMKFDEWIGNPDTDTVGRVVFDAGRCAFLRNGGPQTRERHQNQGGQNYPRDLSQVYRFLVLRGKWVERIIKILRSQIQPFAD